MQVSFMQIIKSWDVRSKKLYNMGGIQGKHIWTTCTLPGLARYILDMFKICLSGPCSEQETLKAYYRPDPEGTDYLK